RSFRAARLTVLAPPASAGDLHLSSTGFPPLPESVSAIATADSMPSDSSESKAEMIQVKLTGCSRF
ncbi:hypothetical protein, partial [Burkholderia ubonensis]|uniref:hypothetical protein n=1 Tax=Burkholderia ubonensis TaxID=101571 RepID=UPI001C43561F